MGRNAGVDDTTGNRLKHVVGNKSDTAVKAPGTSASIIAYLKGLFQTSTLAGTTDIDISESDYTGYITLLTVTAPSTGLTNLVLDLDYNKATSGVDAVGTADDTLDVCVVGKTDGTNERTLLTGTQVTLNGDGSLDDSESGVRFNVGPVAASEAIAVKVKLSAERADAEVPYRVTYTGAAPTVTAVAAG